MILSTWERKEGCGGGKFICFGLDFYLARASQRETFHNCLNDRYNSPFSVSPQQWSFRSMHILLVVAMEETGWGTSSLSKALNSVPAHQFLSLRSALKWPANPCFDKALLVRKQRGGVGAALEELTTPVNITMSLNPGSRSWSFHDANDSSTRILGGSFLWWKIYICWMNEWINAWKALLSCYYVPGIMPGLRIINFIYAFSFFFSWFPQRGDSPNLFTTSHRLYFQSTFHIHLFQFLLIPNM